MCVCESTTDTTLYRGQFRSSVNLDFEGLISPSGLVTDRRGTDYEEENSAGRHVGYSGRNRRLVLDYTPTAIARIRT